jgi:serine/threonine-protein kinase
MLLRESVVELEPGSVLAGRYQIRRVLGKGATGVVLEADDRVSRSLVALKVFKPEIASDDRWQEVVGSELRHARQIMHPNVCRVFDAGEADGYRFLSMEYASGGSLRQRLKEAGTERSLDERVADARAVVNGLAAIHAAGMIHRDVKPDNVLRMEDGRLVLTDFGLAVAPGQTTFVSGYSGAVGTPSYMAPEVAMGGDASMASDVFSLGVILHEVFFDGRPVWETTKRGRFLCMPVHRRSPRILRLIAGLCAECLDELAPRRPQTAVDVSDRFERILLGRYRSIIASLGRPSWMLPAAAILATAVVFLAIRATSDGVSRGTMEGNARDWSSQARLVATRPGWMRCLTVSPTGNAVRLIWGSPPQPAQIDATSGRIDSWRILPETYANGGCPAPSPDGHRLAFTAVTSPRQIMLSENPDGSGARLLTAGSEPRWHPRGQELFYVFDARRVGVVGADGVANLLPETSAVDEQLVSLAVNHEGNRVVTVHRRHFDALVVVHAFPALTILKKMRVPTGITSVSFSPDDDRVLLVGERGGTWEALEWAWGRTLKRAGQIPGTDIVRVASDARNLWFSTNRSWASLYATAGADERRQIATSREFGRISYSSAGDAVVEETMPGGETVIALYRRRDGSYSRITSGPSDRDPIFFPEGNSFAMVDLTRDRISVCSLKSSIKCEAFAQGDRPVWLAGVSPRGDQLAYYSVAGSRPRLRMLTLAHAKMSDFGLGVSRRCRLRWFRDESVWIFQPDSSTWAEFDVAQARETGRREPAGPLQPDGCPAVEQPPVVSLSAVANQEAALWRKTGP